MKRWLIIGICVLGVFLFAIKAAYWVSDAVPRYFWSLDRESFKGRWGFDLYEPSAKKIFWKQQERDYVEYFKRYYYKDSDKIIKQLDKVDMASKNRINQSIIEFESNILGSGETLAEAERIFSQYHIQADLNDYYYYKEADEGSAILILLYKSSEDVLYLLERRK
jgi:hypothetical protein